MEQKHETILNDLELLQPLTLTEFDSQVVRIHFAGEIKLIVLARFGFLNADRKRLT